MRFVLNQGRHQKVHKGILNCPYDTSKVCDNFLNLDKIIINKLMLQAICYYLNNLFSLEKDYVP